MTRVFQQHCCGKGVTQLGQTVVKVEKNGKAEHNFVRSGQITETPDLKPTGPEHRTFLVGLLTDSKVRRYLGGAVPVGALQHVLSDYMMEAQRGQSWIVHVGHRPVGFVSITPHKDRDEHELSYQFMPRVWGTGIAEASCRRVLWQIDGQPVIAETQAANSASIALLGKLGFREIDRLTRYGAPQIIFRRAAQVP